MPLRTDSPSPVAGLEVDGDAGSAKSFSVLPLIFITDCSPIDWLQSVVKIRSFENVFFSFLNFFQASRFLGGLDHLGNTLENPYLRGVGSFNLGFWILDNFGFRTNMTPDL